MFAMHVESNSGILEMACEEINRGNKISECYGAFAGILTHISRDLRVPLASSTSIDPHAFERASQWSLKDWTLHASPQAV